MGFFDKGHEKESPIGNLRAHIGTFMYFVKVGKSKFKHKGKVGEIFADMDNTQYLFQQATSGTMYDMKKKLDYTLWDAATHKYTEDIQKLKDELLKAVDEGEESGVFEEEKKEKESEAKRKEEEEKKEEETGDWRSHIKGQMAEAEEKARREAEEKEREMETPAAETEEEARKGLEQLLHEKAVDFLWNYKHIFTHRIWHMKAYPVEGASVPEGEYRWFTPEEYREIPLAGPHARLASFVERIVY